MSSLRPCERIGMTRFTFFVHSKVRGTVGKLSVERLTKNASRPETCSLSSRQTKDQGLDKRRSHHCFTHWLDGLTYDSYVMRKCFLSKGYYFMRNKVLSSIIYRPSFRVFDYGELTPARDNTINRCALLLIEFDHLILKYIFHSIDTTFWKLLFRHRRTSLCRLHTPNFR